MPEMLIGDKYLSKQEQLWVLRAFECLLEEDTTPSTDKKSLQDAVNVILKRKSDVGIVVLGLKPALLRLVHNARNAGRQKAVESALILLRMDKNGNS